MIEWWQQIDLYCERTNFSFWSEPLNFLSNSAFFFAAYAAGRKKKTCSLDLKQKRLVTALITICIFIGAGSGLFHSLAYQWAQAIDVLSIAIYVLTFLFFWTRFYLHWSPFTFFLSLVAMGLVSTASQILLGDLPLAGSQPYFGVLAILIFITTKQKKHTQIKGLSPLTVASILFIISLIFRTIDHSICDWLPIGSHFLWHIINAVVLYYTMIAILRTPLPLSLTLSN
jgi:hypothetical protein